MIYSGLLERASPQQFLRAMLSRWLLGKCAFFWRDMQNNVEQRVPGTEDNRHGIFVFATNQATSSEWVDTKDPHHLPI